MALEVWHWVKTLFDNGDEVLRGWQFQAAAGDKVMQHSILLNDSGPVAMMAMRYLAFDVEIPSQHGLTPLQLEERGKHFRTILEMELLSMELNPKEEAMRVLEAFAGLDVDDDLEGLREQGEEWKKAVQAGLRERLSRSSEPTQTGSHDDQARVPTAVPRTGKKSEQSVKRQRRNDAQSITTGSLAQKDKTTGASTQAATSESTPASRRASHSFRTADLGTTRHEKPAKLLELLKQNTTADHPLLNFQLSSSGLRFGIWYDAENGPRVVGEADGLVFEVRRVANMFERMRLDAETAGKAVGADAGEDAGEAMQK